MPTPRTGFAGQQMETLTGLQVPVGTISEDVYSRKVLYLSYTPLTLLGQMLQYAPDVVNEAHIQHSVRLVQHQHFHAGQVNAALLHVVQKPARGGDDNIHAFDQLLLLRVDTDTAKNHG
jgi:hypothetical protein